MSTTDVPPTPADQPLSLGARFQELDGEIYLTGVQALIRVLVDQARADARAGLRTAGMVSGYPGSPLGGVDIEMGRQRRVLDENRIRHVPGLNEDLAATALFGTQVVGGMPDALVDGVFGMWYGKAPGVDRCGDAFRHGNWRGTSRYGGILAVAGDDPDAKSTIIPSDSNRAFEDWFMPVLFPGDVQDVVDLGLHGYALSRASGLWCGFKVVTNVADASGSASVGVNRIVPQVPLVELDGVPYRPSMQPNVAGRAMIPIEREIVHGRIEIAREYGRLNGLNRIVVEPRRPRLAIVAPGRAYFDLRQSLTDMGLDEDILRDAGVRIMKVGLLWPVHPADLCELADGVDEIVVVEDKRPYLERAVRDALYGSAHAPRVVGKFDEHGEPLLPAIGELDADAITKAIGPRLAALAPAPSIEARLRTLRAPRRELIPLSVDRTAYFCSGCPHNRSLPVPDGSLVGAGIGCHIMAMGAGRADFGEFAGYTHMGAEGAQWIGIEPYVGTKHLFQNLGDGTFFHSGSLAIRFALAAGVDITYKLLYNSAVGMTGGQEVQGALTVPDLTRMLAAEGVGKIVVTTEDPHRYRGVELAPVATVRHRDELIAVQEELAATPGVTVLIHDQQCAAERRRLRKKGSVATPTKRIFVNARVCEMCGDCGVKSNCLSVQSVQTEFGEKTRIHQSSCNLDYSCVLGDCPSFIEVDTVDARPVRAAPTVQVPDSPPAPDVAAAPAATTIQMVGIGGTGVVTVSQVLATAATIDGLYVRNLDLTGSSQKAGPVVSQMRVFADEAEAASGLSAGGADVFMVFDLLTAVSPVNLARAASGHTVAIASTSIVPTGRMAADSELHYPELDELRQRLDAETSADHNVYLDVLDIAEQLFHDHMLGNVVLLGAACQAGVLGISAAAIEQAIDLNGVAVDKNRAAFRWGRWAVADPARLTAALAAATPPAARQPAISPEVAALGASEDLSRSIAIRAADLVGYADRRLAKRYLADLHGVVRRTPAGGECEAVLRAVAVNLYKLMAYKDEYEVARLHTDRSLRDEVSATFGEGAEITFKLHPPMLRAIGLQHKIGMGEAIGRKVLVGLAKMKRLRGTPLDPFGRARVRRVERELVEHYRSLVGLSLDRLTVETADAVAELLALPDLIRGYEEIKLDSVRRYLEEVASKGAQLGVRVPLTSTLAALA
ncbi:MAG: indolepyruvate ferredoxin oxidoreductase family protein [Ilumatobacteraceae bacterium]